jgi:hypothetical protein
MDIFNGHLVLFVNKKGFPMFCSIDLPINVNCKVFISLLYCITLYQENMNSKE